MIRSWYINRRTASNPRKIAEGLYTRGFISYPRTETDQFDKAIDLKKLVEKQFPDSNWGEYARRHETPCHVVCILLTYQPVFWTAILKPHDLVVIMTKLILQFTPFVGYLPTN